MMQADLLDTFLDLVETRSFHRSADRLSVTQSTISARIAGLEAALGVRLFNRSRAGTDLTAEGQRFLPHARSLRHAWAEAQRGLSGARAQSLRIGIQNDLAAARIGDWVLAFRRALPEAAIYVEPDYSAQMCQDLALGRLDFAVLFTPHAQPDLHFTTLGEVRYVLVSSDGDRRADLVPDRYIRAAFAPAFDLAHAAALPEMAGAPLASGQSATIAALLARLGGAGFVLDDAAEALVATGFRLVADVSPIQQPVHAATHLRHRTSPLHRQLLRSVQRHFPKG